MSPHSENWSPKELHDLVFLYGEIKYYLPSFTKLFNTLKLNELLGEEYITKFLRYANHDLPSLEEKVQKLSSIAIDLEWKNQVAILISNILELKKSHSTRMLR